MTSSNYTYQAGGCLPANAPTYVRRQADEDLFAGIKAEEFCYVLNSRQMGKSSLRVQTMQRLQEEGFACVEIDMTSIGSQNLTADQWYASIVRNLVSGFKLSDRFNLRTWWRDRDLISSVQRFSEFIEEVLLENISQKIVIFIDEIDSVLSLPFNADDFFAAIRAFYNSRADRPKFNQLTFVLLGVATPSDLIQNKHISTPFNIGRAIELKGFEIEEAQPLTNGLAIKSANPRAVMRQIIYWTKGQPFLTQKICRLILTSDQYIDIDTEATYVKDLVKCAIINNWESQDIPEHLRTIRDRLLWRSDRTSRLLELYRKVLTTCDVVAEGNNQEQMELRLSGLVINYQNRLISHNHIYREIFNLNWIDRALASLCPYSEKMSAWLVSNKLDDSFLLNGEELQSALEWAKDKSLSVNNFQFLTTSLQSINSTQVENILSNTSEHSVKLLSKSSWSSSSLDDDNLGKINPVDTFGANVIWFDIGLELQRGKKHEEAIKAFEQVIESDTNFHEACRKKMVLLWDLGRYKEAIISYNKAKPFIMEQLWRIYEWDEENIKVLEIQACIEGTQAYNEEDSDRRFHYAYFALDHFIQSKLLNLSNYYEWNNKDKTFNLIRSNIRKFQSLITNLRSLLDNENPNNDYSKSYNQDEILIAINNYEKQISSYTHWIDKGWISIKSARSYKEAIIYYDIALGIKSDDYSIWYERGSILHKLGRYEDSIDSYDKALEIQPDYSLAWYNKACNLALLGKVEPVLECLTKAIDLNPSKHRIYAGIDKDFDLIRFDPRFQALINTSRGTNSLTKENYKIIQDLLLSGNWQEANRITNYFLLKLANLSKGNFLRIEDITKISRIAIRNIDKLWLDHSNGCFGFSIQQSIWNNCLVSNEIANDRYKFGKQVGWHVNNSWIHWKDLNYSLSAPKGHLPTLAINRCNSKELFFKQFFSHIGDCLQPNLVKSTLKNTNSENLSSFNLRQNLVDTYANLNSASISDSKADLSPIKNLTSQNNSNNLILDLPNNLNLELINIPDGIFMMGSDEYKDERPIHQVTLKAFKMSKYPITQKQYQAVMGVNPSHFKEDDNCPVDSVSWDDAKAFCSILSELIGYTVKLPSEEQWEYACRAGSISKYCFGDDVEQLEQYAWFNKNSEGRTLPVGELLPNTWGLYDMHGNIWEWCEDLWSDSYDQKDAHWTSFRDGVNKRVLRGGSWGNYAINCRSSYRHKFNADSRHFNFGFRIVVCSSDSIY